MLLTPHSDKGAEADFGPPTLRLGDRTIPRATLDFPNSHCHRYYEQSPQKQGGQIAAACSLLENPGMASAGIQHATNRGSSCRECWMIVTHFQSNLQEEMCAGVTRKALKAVTHENFLVTCPITRLHKSTNIILNCLTEILRLCHAFRFLGSLRCCTCRDPYTSKWQALEDCDSVLEFFS